MKEVIAKLNELIDTEKEGQKKSDIDIGELATQFLIGFNAINNTLTSSAAASDAQRISLAMRAEDLAKAEARRRALAEKEARQESSEMKSKTGIDLSQFLVDSLTKAFEKQEKKGGILGKLAGIALKITAFTATLITVIKALGLDVGKTFKFLGKLFINIFKKIGVKLKPVFDAIKKTKAFKFINDIFTRISDKVKPIIERIKNTKVFKSISSFISKIGDVFKSLKPDKSGSLFKKFFGILGKLGRVFSRLFAPLTVILGAFAGIFDAVKAFQNEDGDLIDKIIAGISGFFEGFVGFAIGGLLDLGKDLLAWLLGIFGVPEEKLEGMKAFSVTDFLKDLIGNIFDGVDAYFGSLFDGMFEGIAANSDEGFFQQLLGGIMGLASGMFEGVVDFWATIIDGIAGFFGNEDFSFKEWLLGFVTDIWNNITGFFKNIFEKGKESAMAGIQAHINLAAWAIGFARDIWTSITDFFASLIEKGKEGLANIGQGMINISEAVKRFIAGMLPDRNSTLGKLLSKTGIYKAVGVDGSSRDSSLKDTTFIDNSAIIPPKSNVGEALTQAGNMSGGASVTVVNNNGGNVTNTTTSSQTNNTSTASPPVLSGSAMAM